MDLKSVSSRNYFVFTCAFLVLIFTAIKPSFMGDVGVLTSLLFWMLQIGLLLPLAIFIQDALQSIRALNRLNAWWITALAGALSAIFFVPVSLLLDYLFLLEDWSGLNSFSAALFIVLPEVSATIVPVSLSWVAINAPRILKLNFQSPQPLTPSDEKLEEVSAPAKAPEPENHLLAQLPEYLGREVVYIASELHYLRVTTTQGECLILYSLQNAIKDLSEAYQGIQTHRSYWVNQRYVEKIVGKAADRQILTTQGQLVPISRRKYKEVKESLAL